MTQVFHAAASPEMAMHVHASHVVRRTLVIGLTAFLTVVDLFATQAILPSLTKAYHVTPAAMGLAVNASTCAVPILHKAGDVAREIHTTSHWWKNNGDKTVVLLSADLLHDKSDKNM